ncbi:MAG: hypothetical protein ACRENE_17490 [Polyangiaceae bacterium]
MRVVLTPETAAMLESRKRWWRAHRPATADLFEEEFLEAVTLIGERAALLQVALNVRGRLIRRVLMRKTASHLYYEIDEQAGVVTIVSAWGAARGGRPAL